MRFGETPNLMINRYTVTAIGWKWNSLAKIEDFYKSLNITTPEVFGHIIARNQFPLRAKADFNMKMIFRSPWLWKNVNITAEFCNTAMLLSDIPIFRG